jgi:hypothetical protein
MASVFTPCSGVVGVVREGCSETDNFFISVSGGSGDLVDSAIVTNMSLELSGNYQFLHTLNDFIYAYSFGDRIGTLQIGGVGFAKPCSGSKGTLVKAYEWYKSNRISRATNILTIVLRDSESTGTFLGFLTGMKLDVTNESETGAIGHWSMRFEILPEN